MSDFDSKYYSEQEERIADLLNRLASQASIIHELVEERRRLHAVNTEYKQQAVKYAHEMAILRQRYENE